MDSYQEGYGASEVSLIAESQGGKSLKQAERDYARQRDRMAGLVTRAVALSQGAGGRRAASDRHFWGSVLFTRIAAMSESLIRLCPRIRGLPDRRPHWDSTSCATIMRSIVEAYFVFFLMAVDEVADEDEWLTRLNIVQLRDVYDRHKLFRDMSEEGAKPEDLKLFELHRTDLLGRLDKRRHFQTLSKSRRTRILRGDGDLFTQDEILARMGWNRTPFRGWYRYLCAHVHTGPIAFYRMAEQGRGAGVGTLGELAVYCICLTAGAAFLERGCAEMAILFPDWQGPRAADSPYRIVYPARKPH